MREMEENKKVRYINNNFRNKINFLKNFNEKNNDMENRNRGKYK